MVQIANGQIVIRPSSYASISSPIWNDKDTLVQFSDGDGNRVMMPASIVVRLYDVLEYEATKKGINLKTLFEE